METTKQKEITNTTQLSVKAITFNRFEKVADEKGHTIEELVEEVIQQYLQREAEQKMKREMEAFRHLHTKLWAKYPHEYVAIYQSMLVDHDPNCSKLWLRIEQKFPHEVVLIRQVTPEVERIYRVRSPRLVRNEQGL
jgi:hypothetical protein